MKKKIISILSGLCCILVACYFIIEDTVIYSFKEFILHHEDTYLSNGFELEIDLDPLHAVDPGYGDWLVHPCVRYIPEGIGGHKWWMAVTPYPNHNSHYEQPVLYYGTTNDSTPPRKWEYVGLVTNWHTEGYNADPNLFYKNNKLWIIWKESRTENTERNGVMMCSYDGHKFSKPRNVLEERDTIHFGVTAPVMIEINDSIKILATDFEHQRVSGSSQPMGMNSLAVWYLENNNLDKGRFVYQYSALQKYPQIFNFWHTDMAKQSNIYYSVVSSEQATQLLIGRSKDGEHYKYISKPLLSTRGNMLFNLYKASLVVIGNKAYLFYPAEVGFLKHHTSSRIHCQSFDLSILKNL